MTQPQAAPRRTDRLITELTALLADLSGEDLTPDLVETPFLELGFDSLFMGQAAQAVTRDYDVPMTFRALMSDHPSIGALARHLDGLLPADPAPAAPAAPPVAAPAPVAAAPAAPVPTPAPMPAPMPVAVPAGAPVAVALPSDVNSVLQAQMQTMQSVFANQLQMLGSAPAPAPAPVVETAAAMPADPVAAASTPAAAMPAPTATAEPKPAPAQPFKVGRAPSLAAAELTPEQQQFADDLARQYSDRYAGSKQHTAAHLSLIHI